MLAVAFLWHQHQPYYPDPVTGENLMPWVRLHGVKDYWGMATHLKEYPEMACAINLVPSLLVQLHNYTENGGTDRPLQLSRIPADGLTEEEGVFLLDNFFMANPEQMIRPLPRYYELYQRRNPGKDSAQDALGRFHDHDLRDLQVLFNLAWVHPIAFEGDDNLRQLRRKGRYYTEQEKNWLLDKHLEMLREVVPLHRELADRGQVELTTTPFFHPILPLLLDKKLARESVPEAKLPRYTGGYPEDAAVHVKRAIDLHTETFGRPPQGLWPAEGGVAQAMIPLLAQHGVRWIATDEGILGQSTQGFISRDPLGHVRNPDRMYRPYRVREGEHELGIVFRDHALSDMIGFHYQRSEPVAAADDFLRHLREIDAAVQGPEPALVTVILDGENCWEHYPGGGVSFLRTLYQRLTHTPGLRPVKVGDFLEQYPPRDSLPRLSAGSWIGHNFTIWVGHEEDNDAWDALHRTREHLVKRSQQGVIPEDRLRQAWEEVYIAEGSDWFWWYGDDHSSQQDRVFDYLFRKHLQNVYYLLGETPPQELSRPIKTQTHRAVYTLPRSFLDVKIDGRHTFFEWLGAGRYTPKNERGTMALVTPGPIKEIYFGFNLDELQIRVDFDTPARQAVADFDAVRIGFLEPHGWEVVLPCPAGPGGGTVLRPQLRFEGDPQEIPADAPVRVGLDRILEVAIPFRLLEVASNQPVHFYVDMLEGTQSRDRAPREGTVNLRRPTPDFERLMWQV